MMNLHTLTRIPIDDDYVSNVGKAIYAFAYYEWTIIWIIEKMQIGFVHLYSRGKPLTSGNVEKKLNSIVENCNSNYKNKLVSIHHEFKELIVKRNALIHAHPCTDKDGKQILSYQTEISRELPDMKWPVDEIIVLIREIDRAEIHASELLDEIR